MTSEPHNIPSNEVEAFELDQPPLAEVIPISREERLKRVYAELSCNPGLMIPDLALGKIADITSWELKPKYTPYGETRILRRELSPFDRVEIPADDKRRQFRRDREGLEIEVTRAIGEDVLFMIGVDWNYKPRDPQRHSPSKEIISDPEVEIPNSRFTEAQRQVLKHMTSVFVYERIGDLTGKTGHNVSSLLNSKRLTMGVDYVEDVILYAIGERVASVDHLHEGLTSKLDDEQRAFLADFYSLDKEIRERARNITDGDQKLRWGEMSKALGLGMIREHEKKRRIFLHGVRDGIIVAPKPLGSTKK